MTEKQIEQVIKDAVSAELRNHMHCAAQGLSSDEVVMLRRVIKVLDGTAVMIGRAIVLFVVSTIIGLVTIGFWSKVGH